ETVFVKTAVGIRFQGAGRWQDFSLANNTFFQCPIGIAFTVMPNAATGGLSIRRNLFTGTKQADALVQAGYDATAFAGLLSEPAGIEWNLSDRAASQPPTPGEIDLFGVNGRRGVTGFAFDSTDPKSPRFLHPTANSVQKNAPNPRGDEQPWVGTFGPCRLARRSILTDACFATHPVSHQGHKILVNRKMRAGRSLVLVLECGRIATSRRLGS